MRQPSIELGAFSPPSPCHVHGPPPDTSWTLGPSQLTRTQPTGCGRPQNRLRRSRRPKSGTWRREEARCPESPGAGRRAAREMRSKRKGHACRCPAFGGRSSSAGKNDASGCSLRHSGRRALRPMFADRRQTITCAASGIARRSSPYAWSSEVTTRVNATESGSGRNTSGRPALARGRRD
jgi:hypothetical protein